MRLDTQLIRVRYPDGSSRVVLRVDLDGIPGLALKTGEKLARITPKGLSYLD